MAAAEVGRWVGVDAGREDEQQRKTAEEVDRGRGNTCSQCLRL